MPTGLRRLPAWLPAKLVAGILALRFWLSLARARAKLRK
jgi:hypothetical protein